MKLPTFAELDEVAQGLYGIPFANLNDGMKTDVVKIAQAGVLASILDNLAVDLGVSFAETMLSLPFAKIIEALEAQAEQLEEIDKSLAGPLNDVGNWFKKSRLYEP